MIYFKCAVLAVCPYTLVVSYHVAERLPYIHNRILLSACHGTKSEPASNTCIYTRMHNIHRSNSSLSPEVV